MLSDTIAAISTPIGEGAISIVRISGPRSLSILKKIFPAIKKKRIISHSVYYGHIIDPKKRKILDEVLVTYLKKPKTYTRENIVEINCHGGITVTKQVLDLVVSQGARLANPGEFTKRAFVNGRIDLTQAEAVIDLIRAKTENSAAHSLYQLQGGLKKKIETLAEKVKHVLVQLELMIDFSEEEIPEIDYKKIEEELQEIIEATIKLIATAEEGKIYREGVRLVIAGKPNVGKSSLLNNLLEEKRAIVNSIPGTTRDVIEEFINIEGVAFRLCDTAGIALSDDPVEQEGIKRSHQAIKNADLILVVHDITDKKDKPFKPGNIEKRKIINVYNKVDKIKKQLRESKNEDGGKVVISALTGEGIDGLKREMISRVIKKEFRQADHPYLSNARQKAALRKAQTSLKLAKNSIKNGLSPELICLDIRIALDHLGEISGAVTSDDVLSAIFNEFCIGK